jgi:hypothetical protein
MLIDVKMHMERQGGALLAQASLPPKAEEPDLALASSFPARPLASTSLLSEKICRYVVTD